MIFDIKSLIGETPDYDKKQMLEEKDPKSWCKSVSAFANGKGGYLIFGIADNGEIVGLENAEYVSEKISEAIRLHMDPIPSFSLDFQVEDGKTMIILSVKGGEETPYYYFDRNGRNAYHRVGNSSVQCDSVKLRELTISGAGRTFDGLASSYSFSNMSFTKLKSVYKQRTGKDFQDSDFASFGLLNKNDELTNAGALLADESPILQSRIFCTRWNGLTKASSVQDALDDAEYSGSLITLLQEGLSFVFRNSHKGWTKAPDQRIELPDYPERAVTEAIVNALIHRSYLQIGSEVHIDMFDDRIELYSPGGMVDGTRVQDWDIMKVPSQRRNPVIADIFSRLNYMERRGSGFKKIIEDYEFQSKYSEKFKPVFQSENNAFYLTLWNMNYHLDEEGDELHHRGDEKGDEKGDESKVDIGIRADKIEELLRGNPQISIVKLVEQTGFTKRQIERSLEYLKHEGRVKREGSARGGNWIVVK